jgi:ABC-type polysaccharide/polyol phosphate export permease
MLPRAPQPQAAVQADGARRGLGAAAQPLLTMAVFSVVLAGWPGSGRLDGCSYPLFALAALVPWTYFATALTQAGNSLVEQHQLLTKIYFPVCCCRPRR